jgi:hypothetical protein
MTVSEMVTGEGTKRFPDQHEASIMTILMKSGNLNLGFTAVIGIILSIDTDQ